MHTKDSFIDLKDNYNKIEGQSIEKICTWTHTFGEIQDFFRSKYQKDSGAMPAGLITILTSEGKVIRHEKDE